MLGQYCLHLRLGSGLDVLEVLLSLVLRGIVQHHSRADPTIGGLHLIIGLFLGGAERAELVLNIRGKSGLLTVQHTDLWPKGARDAEE